MNGFVFQISGVLWLLLLAPLMGWLQFYARRRRTLVMDAMGDRLPTHRSRRDILRVAAFILMILALARPGYAPRVESTARTGRDVVFALDVSQSMLAEDVSPSRLEVAKQAIRDALRAMDSERVGLVVYAGSASVLCPLTYDYEFVRYMLRQAQPRTVDFGGTTLQSAIEKCTDQVFMEGRGGVQDLVVLTDGGDHGSKSEPMIRLLDEKQVDVLLIGIGDAETGSTIPIGDGEGHFEPLEDAGSPVLTRLDDAPLRELASKSPQVNYLAVGTRPFDLGLIYQEYAKGFARDAAEVGTGVRIYREAALFLLIPALILLLLAESGRVRGWGGFGKAAVCGLMIAFPARSHAADFHASFKSAVEKMEKGDYQGAESRFSEIYQNASSDEAGPVELGVVQFNRGLCLLKLSEAQVETSAAQALGTALQARSAFLAARRGAPGLQRAGVRIESMDLVLAGLRQRVAEQEEAEREMQDALQKLIERLQALLQAQQLLRTDVASKDVPRNPPRRGAHVPKPSPVVAPPDGPGLAAEFSKRQAELQAGTASVEEAMKPLDEKMRMVMPGMPAAETLLTEPLKLIKEVEHAQFDMVTELKVWDAWPAARNHSQEAEKTLKKILEMLSNNDSSAGDSEDSEASDDGDSSESDDSQESSPDSSPTSGDLAADSEMKELPVPNYSAEDILKEEEGSLQFRQQKRGRENAAKVEKDY